MCSTGEQLDPAVRGQDVVYANLAGDLDVQAARIVESMTAAGVQRLVFITSLGIYNEVPGRFGDWNRRQIGPVLGPYRGQQTPSRHPGWTTRSCGPRGLPTPTRFRMRSPRDEPFKGTEVSRKSVAALVTDIVTHPYLRARANLGVNKPGADGDKPAFA